MSSSQLLEYKRGIQFVYETLTKTKTKELTKKFEKYGCYFSAKIIDFSDLFILLKLTLKQNTTFKDVKSNAETVCRKLKLYQILLLENESGIIMLILLEPVQSDRLQDLFHDTYFINSLKQFKLPYIYGEGLLYPLIIDLENATHILIGGSTNSGKTVSLQASICFLARTQSPKDLKMILVDTGGADLIPFNKLPHLLCPVIEDRNQLFKIMQNVMSEMENRRKIKINNPAEFESLPSVVIVIDEFPSIFRNNDTPETKSLANAFSSILDRGRHYKFHLIISAQNPIQKNMKIDLGNITTRIAFRCARDIHSETILGEKGAEQLTEQGEFLAKIPQSNQLMHNKGMYISPDEIHQIVDEVVNNTPDDFRNDLNNFIIDEYSITEVEEDSSVAESHTLDNVRVAEKPSSKDKQLADTIIWALKKQEVSINLLKKESKIGNNTAEALIKKLEDLGIVERTHAKTKRKVLPKSIADLPEELLMFLNENGYSNDYISENFYDNSKVEDISDENAPERNEQEIES